MTEDSLGPGLCRIDDPLYKSLYKVAVYFSPELQADLKRSLQYNLQEVFGRHLWVAAMNAN